MTSKAEFGNETVRFAFDANDEIGQISNLLDVFTLSGSPEMRELLEWDAKNDDKLKNKVRSFQLNTIETLIEMTQQIKSKKLGMRSGR